MAEWQTRRIQNPLSARACGFESHLRYRERLPKPPIAGQPRKAAPPWRVAVLVTRRRAGALTVRDAGRAWTARSAGARRRQAATLGAHVASDRRGHRTAGRADPARVLARTADGGRLLADAVPRVGGRRWIPDRRARAAAQARARRAARPRGELDVGAGALAARRRHHRAAPGAWPPGALAPVSRRQGGAGRAAAVARGGPPDPEGCAAPVRGAARAREGRRSRSARGDREGRREEPRVAGSRGESERAPAQRAAAAPVCSAAGVPRGAAACPTRRRARGATAGFACVARGRRARCARRRGGGYFAATRRSRPSIRCIRNRSVGPNEGAIRRRSSR